MIFSKNKSMVCFSPNPGAQYRLICLPSSGAGSSMFRTWAGWFTDGEVWAANYPGREMLQGSPFADNIEVVLTNLLAEPDLFTDLPIVLYGHSFGALVGFHLAWTLQQRNIPVLGLCAGARAAPQLELRRVVSDMPEAEFIKELDAMGGVPDALRQSKEMLDFFLPVIRADLRLNEQSKSTPEQRLGCPIHVFHGAKDEIANEEELLAWKQATSGRVDHYEIPGGHFFIQESAGPFAAKMRAIISTLIIDDDDLIAF